MRNRKNEARRDGQKEERKEKRERKGKEKKNTRKQEKDNVRYAAEHPTQRGNGRRVEGEWRLTFVTGSMFKTAAAIE